MFVAPTSSIEHLERAAPVAPGTGRLRFSTVGGRTIVERAFASSPLKLLSPNLPGTTAWVYLATYGGGLVGGDAIDLDVEADVGSRAVITTQASTKVYRSTAASSQHLRAHVSDDALLVVAPDPLVCFAGARYTQQQTFELDARASLVLIDWMTAGRHQSGERWAFARCASRLIVRRAGRLVLYDAVTLDPADGAVDARMRRFNCLATAVMTGPAIAPAAADVAARENRDLLVSIAPLRDAGVLIRIAAVSVEQTAHALGEAIAFLRPLTGNPWAGKI